MDNLRSLIKREIRGKCISDISCEAALDDIFNLPEMKTIKEKAHKWDFYEIGKRNIEHLIENADKAKKYDLLIEAINLIKEITKKKKNNA